MKLKKKERTQDLLGIINDFQRDNDYVEYISFSLIKFMARLEGKIQPCPLTNLCLNIN